MPFLLKEIGVLSTFFSKVRYLPYNAKKCAQNTYFFKQKRHYLRLLGIKIYFLIKMACHWLSQGIKFKKVAGKFSSSKIFPPATLPHTLSITLWYGSCHRLLLVLIAYLDVANQNLKDFIYKALDLLFWTNLSLASSHFSYFASTTSMLAAYFSVGVLLHCSSKRLKKLLSSLNMASCIYEQVRFVISSRIFLKSNSTNVYYYHSTPQLHNLFHPIILLKWYPLIQSVIF